MAYIPDELFTHGDVTVQVYRDEKDWVKQSFVVKAGVGRLELREQDIENLLLCLDSYHSYQKVKAKTKRTIRYILPAFVISSLVNISLLITWVKG